MPCRSSSNFTGDERESLGCSARFEPWGFVCSATFYIPRAVFLGCLFIFPLVWIWKTPSGSFNNRGLFEGFGGWLPIETPGKYMWGARAVWGCGCYRVKGPPAGVKLIPFSPANAALRWDCSNPKPANPSNFLGQLVGSAWSQNRQFCG